MLGSNLIRIYTILLSLGCVRSKRQFSREWLKRGWSYLRDIEQRGRNNIRIPIKTVLSLKARVSAVARLSPPQLRSELEAVVMSIDNATHIADTLGFGRTRR